ncbi:Hypoxia up-regulated protein 1 [Tolypocladium ophioglossoides CBS 100239]|uniref:Hypoxia up-regulated protein 1 n=1 Tax=Tolypocladium ophioglossoides (strain CBS 100239) TaxID=1163406 RepID=A0A0L0NJR0_TOLOC|nr:Hypoxia up-regulated protein 1 [Tolypocladium ophioglossoides CBS 100239]
MAIPRRPSPLMVLLGAVFFLSAHFFAAAAVLGVDLGTEYIKAVLVKPGIPLEIVLTKDSRRKETSAVAFKPSKAAPKQGQFPERLYGADAMAIAARFPGEVYPNLKTLLGLPIDDAVVQEYASRHLALQLKAHDSRGTAAFKSNTLTPQEDAWTVEELLAMELQSVQKNAELTAGDGSSVRSIVLTVPPFYTTEEKRAVQAAAELAGLKVLSLVSDGLAVGLHYATSRQFPNVNEGAKPDYHMVFDMGAGSTIATVMRFQSRTVKDIGKFNKTVQEVQVIGSGWDRTLGGDSLNYLIMDDMVSQFAESKGAKKIAATAEGVKSHGRAMAKISKEAERIRHVLSANQNTQASFEDLYEDVDFKYKITRAEFEAMAEAHAIRVGNAIDDAIKTSGIDMGDLTSIILHGGASRTPFVQKALERAAGSSDKIRSNVNADEAAVFGAGFRAAELSPSFRVKEIRISEGPMYQSGLKWTTSNEKPQRQRIWTAVSPMGGPAKEMTFTELNDFSATFYQQVGSEDREIKSMATKNLTATVAAMKERYPSCVETDITFKVAVKLSSDNGEVQVVKAAVECEAEVSEKDGFVDGMKNLFGFGKKDQKLLKGDEEHSETQSCEGSEEVLKDDANSSSASPSTDATESPAPSKSEKQASEPSGGAKPEVKKREIVSIPVEFTLKKAGVPLPKDELTKVKDRLKAFAASDKARFQREEALNQLEAFTYKVRDLLEGETFISRSTEKEQTELAEKASEISDWLYEDGAEATKEEFNAKLQVLQDLVAPIQIRVEEAAKRPELVSSLKEVLNQTTHFVSELRKQIAEFDELQASVAAAISDGSSATSSASSETPTSDFDGLEDDDSNTKTRDAKKETGLVPPPYKKEDVDELDALYKSTLDWLNDIESRQDSLPPTADPALLSKDIMAKRQKVEKAGMDLAFKAVRSMESKAKKPSKSASGKRKSKTKSAEDPNNTIKFSDGNGRLSDEELEQMLEQIKKMDAEKEKQEEAGEGGKQKHDEL